MALNRNGTSDSAEIRRARWLRLRVPIAQDGIVLAPLIAFLALERFRPAWWSSDIGALVLIAALAIIRTAATIMRRRWAANPMADKLPAVLRLPASFVGSIFVCLLVCASLTLVANLLLSDRQPYGIGREGVWAEMINEPGGTAGPQLRAARDWIDAALSAPPARSRARGSIKPSSLRIVEEFLGFRLTWKRIVNWLITLAAIALLFDRLMRDAFWLTDFATREPQAPRSLAPSFNLRTLLSAVALLAVYLGVVTAVPQALRASWLLAPALLKAMSVARACRAGGRVLTHSNRILVFASAAALTFSIIAIAAAVAALCDWWAYGGQCALDGSRASILSRLDYRLAGLAECGYLFRNASLLLAAASLILWRSSRFLAPHLAAMISVRRTWLVRVALAASCLAAAATAYWLRVPKPFFVHPTAHVAALRFSPDGAWLAAVEVPGLRADEHRLRVFANADRGEASLPEVILPSSAEMLTFTPSGQLWARPKDKPVWGLFDLSTGRLQTFGRNPLLWYLSPDEKTLATHSGYGSGITVWDTATGQRRFTAKGGSQATAAGFTPDSRTFAAADCLFGVQRNAPVDNWIDLWDIATGKARRLKVATPDVSHEPIWMMAFSADGAKLAMVLSNVGSEPACVQIYHFPRGEKAAEVKLFQSPSTNSSDFGRVVSIEFGPRADRLTIGYYGCHQLWDVGQSPPRLALTSRAKIAFSPGGDLLAVTSVESQGSARETSVIDVFQVHSLDRIASFRMSNFTPRHLQFLPDGERLLVLASSPWDWRIFPGHRAASVEVGLGDVRTGGWTESTLPRAIEFAVSPDGKTIATIQQDGTTALWKVPP